MSQSPQEPADGGLGRMFAAEEAAIRDDGFTRRVIETASHGISWRTTAIYGAGMAGFGAAVAGIAEMAPHLPRMTGWWTELTGAVSTIGSTTAAQGGASDPAVLVLVAVAAGVTCLVAGVLAVQSR